MACIESLSFLFEGKEDLIVAEIGIDQGNSTEHILVHYNIKQLYAIDPFVIYKEYWESSITKYWEKIGGVDVAYNNVVERLKKFSNLKIIRNFSHDVVQQFKDGEIDIVWIDGNHSYEATLQDIKDWYPKVKEGGFIAGDDIQRLEVDRAVKEYFNEEFDVFKGKRSWFVKK